MVCKTRASRLHRSRSGVSVPRRLVAVLALVHVHSVLSDCQSELSFSHAVVTARKQRLRTCDC